MGSFTAHLRKQRRLAAVSVFLPASSLPASFLLISFRQVSCRLRRIRVSSPRSSFPCRAAPSSPFRERGGRQGKEDRKSTRLNSSHQIISYAVFCLKKKKRRLLLVMRASRY